MIMGPSRPLIPKLLDFTNVMFLFMIVYAIHMIGYYCLYGYTIISLTDLGKFALLFIQLNTSTQPP